MSLLQNRAGSSLSQSNTNRKFTLVGLGVAVVALAAILIFFLWPRPDISKSSQPAASSGGAAPTSASNGAPGSLTQTSEGGQVTVKATWQGTAQGQGGVFQLTLDTHSVNLDSYDLTQIAILRLSQSQGQSQEVKPVKWEAPQGGHHRTGLLTFPTVLPDGQPLVGPGTKSLELVLRGIGELPERVLRWTL